MKLTAHQREALQLLVAGGVLLADRHNTLSVGDFRLSPVTRDVLVKARLIAKQDPKRGLSSTNGFVITDAGRNALEEHPR